MDILVFGGVDCLCATSGVSSALGGTELAFCFDAAVGCFIGCPWTGLLVPVGLWTTKTGALRVGAFFGAAPLAASFDGSRLRGR